jgi:hypothetical protein
MLLVLACCVRAMEREAEGVALGNGTENLQEVRLFGCFSFDFNTWLWLACFCAYTIACCDACMMSAMERKAEGVALGNVTENLQEVRQPLILFWHHLAEIPVNQCFEWGKPWH